RYRARDQGPDKVAEHRADQRRRPADRQAAKPVEDALLDVVVEVDPGLHRPEHHPHRDQRGQHELQVVVSGAGNRAAEQVDEHPDEHHRLQRHVEQLLGRTPDLDQAAAGQREAVPQQAERPGRGAAPTRRTGGGGGEDGRGGHAAASRSISWWPVSVKKTSSRLGRRSASSTAPMPAAASLATTAPNSASPRAGTVSRPGVGVSAAWPVSAWRIAAPSPSRPGSLGRTTMVCPPTIRFSPAGVSWAITRPWWMTEISS